MLSQPLPLQASPNGRPLLISLPLDYTAFCTLHQDAYLRYAQARIADAEASRAVVSSALGELALTWTSALRSSSPEVIAWQLLGRLVRAAVIRSGAVGRSMHRLLPAAQADAVLLCGQLSLSVKQAAALMGEEEPTVRSRLRAGLRSLSLTAAGELDRDVPSRRA
jgi:hypothetical protein